MNEMRVDMSHGHHLVAEVVLHRMVLQHQLFAAACRIAIQVVAPQVVRACHTCLLFLLTLQWDCDGSHSRHRSELPVMVVVFLVHLDQNLLAFEQFEQPFDLRVLFSLSLPISFPMVSSRIRKY